jgi:hypothetical protein
VALVLLGGLLGDVWAWSVRTPLRWGVGAVLAGLALFSVARAAELDALLVTDTRYQAEAWMADHLQRGTHVEVYQKPAYLPRFRDGVDGTLIPLPERTRAGVLQRRPDVVVTSSASRKSITHKWAADWRETGNMLTEDPAAAEYLGALESGQLPYRVATVFTQRPRLLRNRITSIGPEITIYVRQD